MGAKNDSKFDLEILDKERYNYATRKNDNLAIYIK